VATSRKVSRSASWGRIRDEGVNSLSNITGGRVSTYWSRLPAESQNRWHASFRLFNHAASAATAAGVEVQRYSGEYVCEPRCAMVIICLFVSSRPLLFVILVCCAPVLILFCRTGGTKLKVKIYSEKYYDIVLFYGKIVRWRSQSLNSNVFFGIRRVCLTLLIFVTDNGFVKTTNPYTTF